MLFSAPMVRALLKGTKTQTRRLVKPQPIPNSFGKPGPDTGWEIPCHCGGYPPSAMLWPDENGGMLNGDAGHPWVGVDRLWVKETHRHPSKANPRVRVEYRADMMSWGICDSHDIVTNTVIANAKVYPGPANQFSKQQWRPSIFMPRWASRITLEITSVEAERLQRITTEDAKAEGLACLTKDDGQTWKYGIADRDGWPGNDDDGWHWHEWDVDPVAAYKRLWEQINGAGSWEKNPWVWVIKFKRITP